MTGLFHALWDNFWVAENTIPFSIPQRASPAIVGRYNGGMRYSLRTLLIVLAMGPPVLAVAWWLRVELLEILAVALVWGVLVGALVLGQLLLRPSNT